MDDALDMAWIASTKKVVADPPAIVRKLDPLDAAWVSRSSIPKPDPVKAQPTQVVTTKVHEPGWHTHRCPNGHEWSHPDTSVNNVSAHTCPLCGLQDWTPNSTNTRIVNTIKTTQTPAITVKPSVQTVPMIPFSQDCPDGRCPQRPTTIWRFR